MAGFAPPTITVNSISIPHALPAFLQSITGLPNDPPSLYVSVNSRDISIYVTPISTISVISLSQLCTALVHNNESAVALKAIFETEPITKVFFDARMPARLLWDRCAIKLATEVLTNRTYIHEVQLMELALRKDDFNKERLPRLDTCIAKDSDAVINPLGVNLDMKICHLPSLWKKYHDRLTSGNLFVGGSFWISEIRVATQKRLEACRDERYRASSHNGGRSGWTKEHIEEARDSWNDDVCMDHNTCGEWMGGFEHWGQFKRL